MRVLTLFSLLISLSQFAIADIVTFDDLNGYTVTGSSGSYFDGHGSGATDSGSWTTQGVTFNTNQFGPGWSYSNVNNKTTAGFTNQWAAITGSGVGGTGNYVIGTSFAPNGAFFSFSTPTTVNSIAITNSTYSALSMRDGDPPPFAAAKKFGGVTGNDPDFFRVTFSGHSAINAGGIVTGTKEFFLADYRFSDNSLDFIINDWRTLDLTSLGQVQSISIAFESTDNDLVFGMNTPAYVALDNLSFTAVPEPSSLALLGLAVSGAACWRRRRNKFMNKVDCEGSSK